MRWCGLCRVISIVRDRIVDTGGDDGKKQYILRSALTELRNRIWGPPGCGEVRAKLRMWRVLAMRGSKDGRATLKSTRQAVRKVR